MGDGSHTRKLPLAAAAAQQPASSAGGLKLGGWYSVFRSLKRCSSDASRSGRDAERSWCSDGSALRLKTQ